MRLLIQLQCPFYNSAFQTGMNPMNPAVPYLSVVATSRNDDHGGSLLRRTQTFVNALADQVKRYQLPAELIMVEWNPPPDRGPLHEALQWPADLSPLQVRFIQVPPGVHARYRHAESLPLYQMIAKNAGIRRARGKYVLATNIDILFSNELIQFIARRSLQPAFMYRLDRHDVMTDVPMDADVDSRLAYCNSHLVRLNAREGTYYLTAEGEHAVVPNDIVDEGSGISLGSGWYPPGREGGQSSRWVENDAVLVVTPPAEPPPPLVLEVEPGPSIPENAFDLLFFDESGNEVTRAEIRGRSRLELQIPSGGKRTLRLHTLNGGYPIRYNPRVLNFRVYRCAWGEVKVPAVEAPAVEAPAVEAPVPGVTPELEVPVEQEPVSVAAQPEPMPAAEPEEAEPEVQVPEIQPVYERAEAAPIAVVVEPVMPPAPAAIVEDSGYKVLSTESVASNGAGSGPGILGKVAGVLRRAAGDAPAIPVWVPVPGVVRHTVRLCFRLAGRPVVAEAEPEQKPVPQDAEQPVVIVQDVPMAAPVEQPIAVAVAAPAEPAVFEPVTPAHCEPEQPTEAESLAIEPEPAPAAEPVAAEQKAAPEPAPAAEPAAAEHKAAPEPEVPPAPRKRVASSGLLRPQDDPSSDYYYQPANLHTNGCGDFTLLAREHWMDLRGYPEFDMYSFHIDSVFCFAAHHAGVREVVLKNPMRMYHIEHGRGSGWTPEGENDLFGRLRAKGIPWLEYSEVMMWAAQMRRLESPLIFNGDAWGLRDIELPETAF